MTRIPKGSYTFTFNRILPTNNLLLRMHWAKRLKQIETCRELIFVQACDNDLEFRKPLKKIKVDVCFHWKSNRGRRPDKVNVWGAIDKLVVDALVKLRYLKDDSDKFVEWGTVEHKVTGKEQTEVRITELGLPVKVATPSQKEREEK